MRLCNQQVMDDSNVDSQPFKGRSPVRRDCSRYCAQGRAWDLQVAAALRCSCAAITHSCVSNRSALCVESYPARYEKRGCALSKHAKSRRKAAALLHVQPEISNTQTRQMRPVAALARRETGSAPSSLTWTSHEHPACTMSINRDSVSRQLKQGHFSMADLSQYQPIHHSLTPT